jgi:hypothetical protein
MTCDAGVERSGLDGDRRIQLGEREELPLSELGDDPARRHLHADLDLGLGESRQLQAVLVRPASRRGSRTRFTL